MVAVSMDVLLASLVLATILGISLYAITTYSGIYWAGARYLICVSKALRYSDFFLHTRDGIPVVRSDVLVYGAVDCSKLPEAYSRFASRGFSARVCCDGICAGPEGEYDFTLRRPVYWQGFGRTDLAVSVCPSS